MRAPYEQPAESRFRGAKDEEWRYKHHERDQLCRAGRHRRAGNRIDRSRQKHANQAKSGKEGRGTPVPARPVRLGVEQAYRAAASEKVKDAQDDGDPDRHG